MITTTLDLLQWLMEPDAGGPSSIGMGVSKAIKDALTELHAAEKTVENTDQLMVSFKHVLHTCIKLFIVMH